MTCLRRSFSALQRAEIAEIRRFRRRKHRRDTGFSALQRAEIAEIETVAITAATEAAGFSALQRAEIAEILGDEFVKYEEFEFQCSSTSRNC